MVNAWSLADSVINGTLEEDYPIMTKKHESYDDFENPLPDQITLTDKEVDDVYQYYYPADGDPFQQNFLADNDDQAAHHFNLDKEVDRVELNLNNEVNQSENMAAHYFKYHEEEILNDIEDYVSSTYSGHYTGTSHEYRKVQTLDLLAARDIASGFCQANIIKYGSRYGSKEGKEKKDLMKVIHYAMLLLHFDDHYGKPSETTGNIDHQMP